MPTAIPQKTLVAIRENGKETCRIYSTEFDRTTSLTLTIAPEGQFERYLYGCMQVVMQRYRIAIPALDIYVHSNVPIGVGLSSSAALEVATLRATCDLLGIPLDAVSIAQLAQKAEVEYAGVHCGIMDQMAASLADSGSMLFLDTRTLERQLLPLPAATEILAVDCGIVRSLAGSQYNERRQECEHAARLLGIRTLRDIADPSAAELLEEPFRRRVRHVITENNRVLRACQSIAADEFGELMNASHRSLRDDYEVSITALDRLVGLLQEQADVYGARLTGAGFGGACVALCRQGKARTVAQEVLGRYRRAGYRGRLLVPPV